MLPKEIHTQIDAYDASFRHEVARIAHLDEPELSHQLEEAARAYKQSIRGLVIDAFQRGGEKVKGD